MFKKTILFNSTFASILKISGLFLSLITVSFIARILGKESFGIYNIIFAYLYIFWVFADFGLYSLLQRELARARDKLEQEKVFSGILLLRLATFLLSFALAIFLIFFLPYKENAKQGALIVSLSFLFMSMRQLFGAVFQRRMQNYFVSISDFIERATQLLFVFYILKTGSGFFAILWSSVLSSLISFIFLFGFLKTIAKPKIFLDKPFLKKTAKEALPIFFSFVFILIYFKADTIMLSLMKNEEAVAFYGLAYKIFENIIYFPAMISTILMPVISRYFQDHKENFSFVIRSALNILTFLGIPTAAGLLVVGEPVLTLMGGREYSRAFGALFWLSLSLPFIFWGALMQSALIAAKKQKEMALNYFAGMLLNVGLNFIFIPKFSYIGAAATTLATEIFVNLRMVYILRHFLNKKNFYVFLKTLMSASLMYLALKFLSLHFVLAIILGIAIYSLLSFLLRSVDIQESKKLLLLSKSSSLGPAL